MKNLLRKCFFTGILGGAVLSSVLTTSWAQETSGAAPASSIAPAAAPLLEGLGDLRFPITTRSQRAQKFFDQGFRLAYGFNHAEAIRAFKEAARLDPDCAMAFWGEAWALGPNINLPMSPEAAERAYEAVQKAVELKSETTAQEQALIEALEQRYSADENADQKDLDLRYANAMREVSRRFPENLDIATMFAESLMVLRPWNFWTKDGRPNSITPEMVAVLESVLRRNPDHAGAIHYYIHAVEASPDPGRALPYADRLGDLMPGAGHMVHMPSHIYIHVGQYAKGSDSNQRAIAADEDYIVQCRAQGVYPLAYYPHNVHFLWFTGMMEGRKELAVEAGRKLASKVLLNELPDPNSCGCCRKGLNPNPPLPQYQFSDIPEIIHGFYQELLVTPLYALTRFGEWDQILQESKPPQDLIYLTGAWHYARGRAFAAQAKFEEAALELRQLQSVAANPEAAELTLSRDPASAILEIAAEVLSGELAAARGHTDKALAHLERGVRLEEALNYIEPPTWYFPVRHSLAAVLEKADRPLEAESVYWADLKVNRENGWSLFGLMRCLEAQGKEEEAAAIRERFEKAWARADYGLSSR
jgi:tetratricopeptide (TPR) repeat protein